MDMQIRKKKIIKNTVVLLMVGLMTVVLPFQVQAGDTWPFEGESTHGVNQPSVHGYTSGHILDWSPETDPDADMLRSFVPLHQRIEPFNATQARPNLNPNVKMTNVSGDYGNAFIENAAYTNKFAQYHFGFWQYVDYWSPWHGTATAYTPAEYYDDLAQSNWKEKWFEFGMLNIPNPTYTDAAHKNGVMSLAGVFFSNNDRGQQTYKQMIVKDANGEFPVAKKMIEMAEYFGYDGYFINQEEQNPNVQIEDIPNYIRFIQELKAGGLYIQWYDSLDTDTGNNTFARTFRDNNISFLYDKKNKEAVSDSYFFDYGMGDSQINSANSYLEKLNTDYGTNYSIYDAGFAGLEAGRDRFSMTNINALQKLVDSNGVPRVSIATLGADFVHAGLYDSEPWPSNKRTENEYQWEANQNEQKWWSGTTVDPLTSSSNNWAGIASVITERSVIGDTNFYTNFNTGHGLSYYKVGAVSNDNEWSNMSLQDVPVTWQWWQDTTGNRLTVDYDYGTNYKKDPTYTYQQIGGYDGGSSIAVSANLDADNFLRLYKTELEVNSTSKLSIAYNKPSANDASSMSIGLIFKDQPGTVVKVPVADGIATTGWETNDLDLSMYAGRTIAAFGLYFAPNGETIADYQMNVGQIRIYDGSTDTPSAPTGLAVTNLFASTNEMVLGWDMNSDYSQVKSYNVYVNDVFVGGKYDETFYVKDLPARSGIVKVVPVGADGLEGDAASIVYDLDTAVFDIKTVYKDNGELEVSWVNPPFASDEITINVKSLNKITTDTPISETKTASAGTTSILFSDMPVNGDDYIVSISVGNHPAVAESGNFMDTTIKPYEEAWSWNDNKLNLPMPNTRDWRYMYVYENGVALEFDTTYSSGKKPYIVRGRSTKASLSVVPQTTDSMVTVVLEDYAGNKSTATMLRDSKQDLSKTLYFVTDLDQARTVHEGDLVDLQVEASESTESMVWEMKSFGEDTWTPTTVTSAVYSFTAEPKDHGTMFRVVLTGKEGIEPTTLTSNELTLMVEEGNREVWIKLQELLRSIDTLIDNDKYTAKSIAALTVSDAYIDAKTLTLDTAAELLTLANTKLVKAMNEVLVLYFPVTSPTNPSYESGSGTVVDPNPVPADPSMLVILTNDLTKSSENGRIIITAGEAVTDIELPIQSDELLGKKTLQLQMSGISIDIAAEILKKWKDSIDNKLLSGSKFQITLKPITLTETALKKKSNVKMKGNTVAVDFIIMNADGKVYPLTDAINALHVTWPLETESNADLVGIYQIFDNGEWEYLGGSIKNGAMEINLWNPGEYALMEYEVSYTDVPSNNWALDTIKNIAAKHLIQGTTDTTFEPNRAITRAEFVNIVVNMLDLEEKTTLQYDDVSSEAWYADALSKAVKAGLVTGKTTDSFEPDATITREELVTILMRAHALVDPSEISISSKVIFADEVAISSWALEQVTTAHRLGFIQGREANQFVPKGIATRAEAAQFILNFIH